MGYLLELGPRVFMQDIGEQHCKIKARSEDNTKYVDGKQKDENTDTCGCLEVSIPFLPLLHL